MSDDHLSGSSGSTRSSSTTDDRQAKRSKTSPVGDFDDIGDSSSSTLQDVTMEDSVSSSPRDNQTKLEMEKLPTDHLLILLLDVGQGECTVIVERATDTAGKSCIVIDGGYGTAGRGVLVRTLKALEIEKIDLMICTHFDGDHTKGLTSFLDIHAVKNSEDVSAKKGYVHVKKLLVRNNNKDQHKSSTKLKLLAAALSNEITVEADTTGSTHSFKSCDATLECVFADSEDLFDENRGSLSYLLKFDGFRYYTGGDLPSDLENKLAGSLSPLSAFKCGHHGSVNSTPGEFIAATTPQAAFISCGIQNFGHPTFGVIEQLCAAGSPVASVYATNCIHARRNFTDADIYYQNAKIALAEIFERKELKADFLTADLEDFSGLDALDLSDATAVNAFKELISASYEKIDKHKGELSDEEELKTARAASRILKAANKQLEHSIVPLSQTMCRVAGNDSRMGTIAIFAPKVDEPGEDDTGYTFFVGFEEADATGANPEPAYYIHERSKDVVPVSEIELKGRFEVIPNTMKLLGAAISRSEDDDTPDDDELGDDVISVDGDSEPLVVQIPSSPTRTGDTTAFTAHFVSRTDSYVRFTAATLVGLSARTISEQKDFCELCRLDLEQGIEAQDPANELIEVEHIDFRLSKDSAEPDPPVVHRGCLISAFVENASLNQIVALWDEDQMHGVYIAEMRDEKGHSSSGEVAEFPDLDRLKHEALTETSLIVTFPISTDLTNWIDPFFNAVWKAIENRGEIPTSREDLNSLILSVNFSIPQESSDDSDDDFGG